ncbi:MAG: prolipoprotein diacylglyceryl transferase, partial [Candidatus Nanopelagicales bacterium]|nr:prolipoprotein diacylglyceryl transferase [Candidatus Nanopelagicales bacterium]
MLPLLASIPSPEQGVWNLGPVPIRAYAFAIILGIVLAVWIGNRRYEARGGQPGTITDLAIWAVPFGIVGGRLYHVITDHQLYFGPGGSGLSGAIRVWDGGLGIWGAIALGAVGAWIGARRKGVALLPVAD